MDITERESVRIGETIRSLREARGFTQEELAHELRISRPYMSLLESGRKPITARLVALAAEVLGVRQAALVREGYFDREAAEREAEVRRLRRERDDALTQIGSMQDQLNQLRGAFEALQVPKEVA